MMFSMRRLLGTAPLVIVLAVIAGLACWLWQVHDLGRSCGYAPGHGLPYFPEITAYVVLVASPALLVGVSAALERRRPLVILGFMVVAAALSALAFGAASLAFLSSRGCVS
jgi:hypothetical protein